MTDEPTLPDESAGGPPTAPPPGAYPPYPPYPQPYPPGHLPPGPHGGVPPYPYPYPYPYGLGSAPAPEQKNGLGVAALIVGIAATIFSCTVIGGFVGGIVAIILGILGLVRARRSEADNPGVAAAGIALGGFALLLSTALVFLAVYVFNSSGFGDYLNCVSAAQGNRVRVSQCENDFQQRINDRFGTTGGHTAPPRPTR